VEHRSKGKPGRRRAEVTAKGAEGSRRDEGADHSRDFRQAGRARLFRSRAVSPRSPQFKEWGWGQRPECAEASERGKNGS
jgi:hypothetical protein